MNRIGFLVAVSSVFMLVGAQSALADDCASLGGTIVNVPPNECQVSTAGNHATGSKTLNETLHILTGGSIIVDAPNISIDITTGDFVMENGALIDGNVKNGGCPGKGSDITVTLDNGDIDLQSGSIIRSDSCTGGAIVLTTTGTHTVDIGGLVESVGSRSGDGSGLNGGGPITIVSGCSVTVGDTGVVSSRGAGPGADLLHLEGCRVTIHGLVESTAAGHVNPTKPGNKCNDGVHVAPFNLAPHSSFFTGCVEIWAGFDVFIDSTPPHKGEVNADVGSAGGTGGRGWVDIYANGDITIVDGTGNDYRHHIRGCTYPDVFAVHSNGGLCQNTDDGGLITIKSLGGNVFASGNAIQADATSAGSYGGEVHVEAYNDIFFDGGTLSARGDDSPVGGFGIGGKLGTAAEPIRAFNGMLCCASGEGNVLPTGTGVPAASRGVINLAVCPPPFPVAPLDGGGASFPFDGVAATTPTRVEDCSGGSPTKATPGALRSATCSAQACVHGSPISGTSISGTKFLDLAGNHVRDVGDPGLASWEIKAFQGGVEVANAFTDGSGAYTLNVAPGSYTVCEVLQYGHWVQTYPSTPNPSITNLCPAPPVFGYAITLVPGQNETGIDFGNFRPGGRGIAF